MDANLEIYVKGRWHHAARLSCPVPEAGYTGRSHFTYDEDYALSALQHPEQAALWSVCCAVPPSFELHSQARWPAFILDILPSGAGRRTLLALMQLADSRAADWAACRCS